jgi:predicted nucleotidyltransferase
MSARKNLKIPQGKLAEFCKRNHIRKLSLFGSVIRDDFSPDSDLDVLVEFEPACTPGLIKLAGMEIELSEILGRKADLRTAEDLSKYFRQEVVQTAEVQYAEG